MRNRTPRDVYTSPTTMNRKVSECYEYTETCLVEKRAPEMKLLGSCGARSYQSSPCCWQDEGKVKNESRDIEQQ